MKALSVTILLIVVMLLGAACGGGGVLAPAPGPAPGGGDNTAPDIQINGIDDGTSYGVFGTGANVVNVTAVAADPSGITNISMRINGTLVASANGSNTNYVWDVTGYDDGEYVVEVQATDTATNTGTTSVQVTVDNVLNFNPGLVFPFFPEIELIPIIPGP